MLSGLHDHDLKIKDTEKRQQKPAVVSGIPDSKSKIRIPSDGVKLRTGRLVGVHSLILCCPAYTTTT